MSGAKGRNQCLWPRHVRIFLLLNDCDTYFFQKLIEEADEQWRILFLEQVDKIVIAHDVLRLDSRIQISFLLNSNINRLKEVSLEERDTMKKELQEVLLKEFHQEIRDRRTEMKEIVNKAMLELEDLEKNLPKTSESQYYTSTQSPFL